jgi:fructose-1,6-bisphosphatase/inositol monophosphatase family enzyme
MSALDTDFLLAATRRLHEAIRVAVRARLEQARTSGRPELANQPGAWGAGDLSYALDEVAEAPLHAFGREISNRHPLVLIAEGPGVQRHDGPDGVPLRAIIDPVDGTRSLMHDMRSGWALTGLALDRGDETRLSDIQVGVQTELPTTSAAVYHVLTAVRGEGARIARHDVSSGECLESQPLAVAREQPLDNGYFAFTRYLAIERPLVAELERGFLERAIAAHALQPRLIYDDQYLCSAGQLYLVTTGRYRVLADLRGWLQQHRGLANFTAKPYDLAALLIYQEAGVPVLDAQGLPLDAPLDTETPLSVVAYGNAQLREAFEGHLMDALAALA